MYHKATKKPEEPFEEDEVSDNVIISKTPSSVP